MHFINHKKMYYAKHDLKLIDFKKTLQNLKLNIVPFLNLQKYIS